MWSGRGDDSYHETAEVCLNGHATTSGVETSPELAAKRCPKCGEETTRHCPHCSTPIRGAYVVPGVISGFSYSPPPFCHECGNPLPWTARKMDAARELADELESLSPSDKRILTENLADLTTETPRTMVAAVKVKRILAGASGWAVGAFRRELEEFAVEKAREILFNSP